MSPWVEKHRPKEFSDIKGQEDAVAKVINFINNFKTQRKKAMFLYGPPGTGKTTLAQVAAKETNSEIFELNASDFRDKNKLQETLKPALQQQSLLNKGKIILIDEADGIMGTDRGGIPELIKLIEGTKYPIILTANDAWKQKLSPLRKKVELVEMKGLDHHTIKDVLISVLRKENKFIESVVLTNISAKAKGDLRAAINDLQTISEIQNPREIELDERNKEVDIFQAMKRVFQGKPTEELLKIYDPVNLSIDDIILWIEKNIPKEYKGIELAKAYDRLSKTDIFKGRIYKQQYWRFLVYENIFLSYGMAAVKDEPRANYTSYEKPSRILKIWLNNQKTFKKKSISQKYARLTHMNIKRATNEFPIIKQIINSNEKIKKELDLTEEELAYLER